MGSGIAEVAARGGIDVRVAEATPDAIEAGRRRLTASLDRALRSHKLGEEQRDQALANVSFTRDLTDMADRQFVIEAVAENRDIKTDVLRALDNAVEDPAAVLATNTSSIPVVDLAVVTERPARVIGMHFFNPVPVQRLVELVPTLTTDADTVLRTRGLAEQLDKQASGIHCRASVLTARCRP